MKKLLTLCMAISGLLASAQQYDTLYIYDLYTDGDYTSHYSGDNLGGNSIHFSFGDNAVATINTKLSGVSTRKIIAKKAWIAGIMIIKPVNQSIKIYIKGEAIFEGALQKKRIIPINDSLIIDTVKAGLQYYVPQYNWKMPLLGSDYPVSFKYVNTGTYFHDCLVRKKKRSKLLPHLQSAILWQYNSESSNLIRIIKASTLKNSGF